MAKNRTQKEELLNEYKDLLKKESGFIAINPGKIEADIITQLKLKLKELGSNLYVIKNTLFRIAAQDTNQPLETQEFTEKTAIVPYSEDPTVIAKLIKEVQKETDLLNAKFGVIAGNYMESTEVMKLADIPSREELLAKMLGSLQAPLSGFAQVAKGNIRSFTQVVKELSQKES